MWERFVNRLLCFCAACPFLVVGWIGLSLAANPQRYSDEPPAQLERLPTCTHIIAIDDEAPFRSAQDTAPAGPLAAAPSWPKTAVHMSYPPGEDPIANELRAEIDLIRRRLTWEGRNDTR